MRDGFYGSQLIASLNGSITVVNSSMARQFIGSYEWMWQRPSGCKLPGCEGAKAPIPDGIFPQACTLRLPPAPQAPHCDYGQGGSPNLDLDTCAFAVKSLHVGFKVLGGDHGSAESAAFFNKYKASMVTSLAATTKDPAGSGLLWSNTSSPMVGYVPSCGSPPRRRLAPNDSASNVALWAICAVLCWQVRLPGC